MRKLIKTSAGWVHTTLILAVIIPVIYALCVKDQAAVGSDLYLKCLIIFFPVITTDLVADKCRSLLSWLILCALIFAVTGASGWILAGSLHNGILIWGYILLLLGETLFVIINRLTARLQKKKEREAAMAADPTFHPFYDFLKEPAFPVLLYFGAVYLIAVNFNSPAVCNAALFSTIVYAVITFLYQYVSETEHYLSLNRRTCNLPSKRIYGIGSGILAIYLLVLMILVLPSLFTISHRHYRDLRDLTSDVKIDYVEMMMENNSEDIGESPLDALLAEYGDAGPAPWWVDFIFYIVTAIIFAFLAIALMKKVFLVFRDFRMTNDENGDIVEELHDTEEAVRKIKAQAGRRKFSEKEQIRKEYRKVIRRHRKDRPAVYESPTEIETNAGIVQTEDGRELHIRYELARYGRE